MLELDAGKSRVILVILLCFIVYLGYLIIQVLNRKDVASYQVRSGSLAMDNIYRGVILKEEEVVFGSDTGYVLYFAREGEHMGSGDLVYAIDETGSIKDSYSASSGESSLSDTELKELRSEIMNFSAGFSPVRFSECYDFMYSLDGSLLKLENLSVLDTVNSLGTSYASDTIKLRYAPKPGYVIYHTDGYESLSVNGLTPAIFDESTYEKEQLSNNALLGADTPVYKLLTSENWSVAIITEPERAQELLAEKYVYVRFPKNQQKLWASVEVVPVDAEQSFVILGFNTSVVNFCTDRFLDVELMESNENGLKIPVSSIVHKEFFLVPKDYALDVGEGNSCTFLRKTFLENGSASSERMEISVYSADDEYFYVDDTQLRIGDYLLKPDDLAEYPVSMKGELVGVYNINKGYADFRQISIIYQNDEYAIVKPNTRYGLNEFDYIALDASVLKDDEFVFE
ncbi:MAG: hypothetical protein IKI75_09195 [Lachnospiraceae bacterium]|nr:hypothetical protein [Lachnospiraceae bacterium]